MVTQHWQRALSTEVNEHRYLRTNIREIHVRKPVTRECLQRVVSERSRCYAASLPVDRLGVSDRPRPDIGKPSAPAGYRSFSKCGVRSCVYSIGNRVLRMIPRGSKIRRNAYPSCDGRITITVRSRHQAARTVKEARDHRYPHAQGRLDVVEGSDPVKT